MEKGWFEGDSGDGSQICDADNVAWFLEASGSTTQLSNRKGVCLGEYCQTGSRSDTQSIFDRLDIWRLTFLTTCLRGD